MSRFSTDTQHHIRGEELDDCVPAAHRSDNVFPEDQRGHHAEECEGGGGSDRQYTAPVAASTAAAAISAAAVPAAISGAAAAAATATAPAATRSATAAAATTAAAAADAATTAAAASADATTTASAGTADLIRHVNPLQVIILVRHCRIENALHKDKGLNEITGCQRRPVALKVSRNKIIIQLYFVSYLF